MLLIFTESPSTVPAQAGVALEVTLPTVPSGDGSQEDARCQQGEGMKKIQLISQVKIGEWSVSQEPAEPHPAQPWGRCPQGPPSVPSQTHLTVLGIPTLVARPLLTKRPPTFPRSLPEVSKAQVTRERCLVPFHGAHPRPECHQPRSRRGSARRPEQLPVCIFKHKVFFHVFWARSTQNALMSCSVNKETMATHTELPRELLKQGLIVNKQPDDVRLIY